MLSTKNPVDAIRSIQRCASLQDPTCKPLLGLLDQLGFPRQASCHHNREPEGGQACAPDKAAQIEAKLPQSWLANAPKTVQYLKRH